ncbi:MAG: carboxypeptidase regulatory-like domain-containing protein [Blastocatellia bacterium]
MKGARVIKICASAASLLAVLLMILTLTVGAQTKGAITGRVVTDDGSGMANVTVVITSVGSQSGAQRTATTDEEGNFRFTDLPARSYGVSVFGSREYVQAPLTTSESNQRRYYRLGESANITLIRGGVITGRVTNANGEPVVGIQVSAIRVRDAEGQPVRGSSGGVPRMTDDRGVYRLYGLQPGAYVVAANASHLFIPVASPYDHEVPTYYPSSTRDAAAEVAVASGSEASSIDIRYRGERGHAVSGKVSGVDLAVSYLSALIYLTHVATGAVVSSVYTNPNQSGGGFAFYGVADGEYDLVAERSGDSGSDGQASQPRRVTVRGADLTGIELKLAPQASIAGKVILEPIPQRCEDKRPPAMEEVVLQARRDEAIKASLPPFFSMPRAAPPNEKGEFLIQRLNPARYRLQTNLSNENWYLKSITASASSPSGGAGAASGSDPGRSGLLLKSGERASGVTVTIAEGAASLRGKVVADKEGSRSPARILVYLMPAETASADDVLRYSETMAGKNGAFEFKQIAPGKYRLLARAAPEDHPSDVPALLIAWDANERAKLRREAEAVKLEVELKPCQRVTDQLVKYSTK